MRLLDLMESLEGYYGWINRVGKFLPGDHGTIIKQNFRDQIMQDFNVHSEEAFENIDDGECYGYGFKQGWIRVSRSQRETAFELGRYTTSRAFQGMIRLIKEVDRQDGGMIGIQFNNHYDAFATARQAIQWLTRMQRRIITEAVTDIPGTEYGYWVTHEGKFIPVNQEEHWWEVARYFRQHHPEVDLNQVGHFEAAYKKGWIRIIDNGDPEEDVNISIWMPEEVRPGAARAMLPYLRRISNRHIYFETRAHAPLPNPDFKSPLYPTRQELYQYFWNLYKTNRALTETEIPATEYGYWINPEGRYIPVPGYSHDEVAAKLFQTHPDIAVDRAVQRGWIRVATRDDRFLSQMRSDVGKLPLRSLIELARKTPSDKYYFDFVADRNRGKSHTFTEQGQAMRFLNELMRTRTV